MSLATRCTHCGTIFKVVQDQLKVSEGWVRCGRCNEVFNALPTLFDLEREAPPQRPANQTGGAFSAAPQATPQPDIPDDAGWQSTAAGMQAASEDDFAALGEPPMTGATSPTQAATDFDLDTAVGTPSGMPPDRDDLLEEAPALLASDPDAGLEPVRESEMPEDFSASRLPVTDEADALDSRYLLPSERIDRRPPVRRDFSGPDFADAEFPSDALGEEPGFAPTETPAAASLAADLPVRPDKPGEAKAKPKTKSGGLRQRLGLMGRPRPAKDATTKKNPTTEPAPEFMRQAARQAFWRHPAMRLTLAVLALLLSLTLALQIAHQLRNQLAAYHPELRAMLQQWCELAGCQITPPLRLDALQVESATLVRTNSEGPDTYRLVVVVHNRAPIDLAWPTIDLSLTDTDGSIVARKAFRPQDAQWFDNPEGKTEGPASTKPLPAAVPADRSTALQWRLKAPELKLVGYTAELFYP